MGTIIIVSPFANSLLYTANIIQDGPATANYDEDLGTVPLTEWYYQTGFAANEQAQAPTARGPPPADNILVNGKHKSAKIVDGKNTGEYFKLNVKKVSGLASFARDRSLMISKEQEISR